MELNFDQHVEKRMQRGGIPRGIVELIIRFGELEHRCGTERYSVTRKTIKRIRSHLGPESGRVLERYAGLYAITIENRVVTVARNDRPSRRTFNDQ
jgi:hypothetical protein